MSQHFPLMYAGASSKGKTLEVVAPWDQKPIATVQTADADAVEGALATAHKLFRNRDNWLTAAKRIAILEKTIELMTERFDELAVEAAREGGKPLPDSKVEVARAIDSVRVCVETLRTQHGTEVPMGINPASTNRLAWTTHEPIGVVVAVSAFNHPLNLIVHQVAPAVAVGCPVVVKPANDTPLSCMRFVQILHEAGLPPEWCQAGATADRQVATRLVADPRVAFFSFIGSPGVGWSLRSQLAPGTRCALEHGGAAPVIVAADANMDDVLPLLAKGGYYHAGQVCVSVQRVFVERKAAQKVAKRLAELGSRMKLGDPTLPDTEVGPLIRPAEVKRVDEWVQEAVRGGAGLLSGGKPTSDTSYANTLLYDPPAGATISRKEVFGPAVCVYPYDDMDEAIERANGLDYAFQAAVCTSSLETALRAYRRLDASAVMVNDHTAFRVDWMPFAGLRQSGHGVGGIHHTMHDMQIEKMLVLRSKNL